MLERFMICDNGLENRYQNNFITGYRIKIGIPYYRSVPLSCIEEITLMVDNKEVDPNSITLELGGAEYSLSELSTRIDIWWGFQEKGYLVVRNEGGINQGKHEIKIHFIIRVPYLIPTNGDFLPNYVVTNTVKYLEVNV
jgi:hypothetical protein